jgi:hypothetical protein
MSKKKNIEMTKLYCLSQLLLESLDILKPTTDKMVKYKTDLIALCEELNNVTANTYTVQKSTYFSVIANKIDTVLRHEFKDNM